MGASVLQLSSRSPGNGENCSLFFHCSSVFVLEDKQPNHGGKLTTRLIQWFSDIPLTVCSWLFLLVWNQGESDGRQADGEGMQGRAVAVLTGFGLCSVHFGIWPFEGRLLPQCQPQQPKVMGHMDRVSLAHNNCISLCDTEIPV